MRTWVVAVGAVLFAHGCGGGTTPAPVSPSPTTVVTTPEVPDAGPPPAMDASVPEPVVDAGPPVAPPPNRTRDYYLRWRFDPAPNPSEEGSEATYSHVFLEVHSASGVQEVDTEVTDANCRDDSEHLTRRQVLRAKCWFGGAGWEIEAMYRDSALFIRRRAVDEAMNRNPTWRPITRITVPPRSTVETAAGPFER